MATDGIPVELRHYQTACAELDHLLRHADELLAEIDAIEDRNERIRTLVAMIAKLHICQTMLVDIRLRAERNANKGFRELRKAVRP